MPQAKKNNFSAHGGRKVTIFGRDLDPLDFDAPPDPPTCLKMTKCAFFDVHLNYTNILSFRQQNLLQDYEFLQFSTPVGI